MTGCCRKDSICITLDCPLRHYQACCSLSASKAELILLYYRPFGFCFLKVCRISPAINLFEFFVIIFVPITVEVNVIMDEVNDCTLDQSGNRK